MDDNDLCRRRAERYVSYHLPVFLGRRDDYVFDIDYDIKHVDKFDRAVIDTVH